MEAQVAPLFASATPATARSIPQACAFVRPRASKHGAASHAVLTVFAQSMMGTAKPAYPATLSKA